MSVDDVLVLLDLLLLEQSHPELAGVSQLMDLVDLD